MSHVEVVKSLLGQATSGGSGILVIGGGKSPADDVTRFWNEIGHLTGTSVDFVSGQGMSTKSFAAYQALALVSSAYFVSGGLDDSEAIQFANSESDVLAFLSSGGVLVALAQDSFSTYDFLGVKSTGVGQDEREFEGIVLPPRGLGNAHELVITEAGVAAGLTPEVDICCWHQVLWPEDIGLEVLATGREVVAGDQPYAVGGRLSQ
ncbi:MAG TPA: hypothetical protein VMR52_11095 [Dehalococcoidia bacterium]|nr:hypothetical protein [Dehalococcoidia bacterium]